MALYVAIISTYTAINHEKNVQLTIVYFHRIKVDYYVNLAYHEIALYFIDIIWHHWFEKTIIWK